MKLIVFSDTHGNYADMLTAIDAEAPDAVFHLGDCIRDTEEVGYVYPKLPLYQVPGNCDWLSAGDLPTRKLVSLDGVKFLLCHGHTYGVKSGYSTAVGRAVQAGADVLLCGHTHIPLYEEHGGLQLMNPGSLRYTHTYGVITTQRGVAMCNIRTLK